MNIFYNFERKHYTVYFPNAEISGKLCKARKSFSFNLDFPPYRLFSDGEWRMCLLRSLIEKFLLCSLQL